MVAGSYPPGLELPGEGSGKMRFLRTSSKPIVRLTAKPRMKAKPILTVSDASLGAKFVTPLKAKRKKTTRTTMGEMKSSAQNIETSSVLKTPWPSKPAM